MSGLPGATDNDNKTEKGQCIMKKTGIFLLTLSMAFSLTACSQGTASSNENESAASNAAVETTTAAAETSAAAAAEISTTVAAETPTEAAGESGGKTLIAYFSWSGNTERMASLIQQETGGDLFEIAPAVPYTDDYDALLDQARDEQTEGARPELAAQVEDWQDYDVIFVGYPNWWSDAPMAVYTFLESYDFNGKTLIPFNTSASGGFGRSLTGLEESAAGAVILDGLALTEGDLDNAESAVSAWIDTLDLN